MAPSFIKSMLMLEKTNYTFIREDDEVTDSMPVYVFDQFIITRKGDSLVQAVLTVFDKYLDFHNFSPFNTCNLNQENLHEIPRGCFEYFDPKPKQDMIKALVENNINILEHDIVHHTRFHYPTMLYYASVGELQHLLVSGEHDEVSWSLHIIDSSENI
jgi:hypothetical protein